MGLKSGFDCDRHTFLFKRSAHSARPGIAAWRSCFPKVWTVWRDRHDVRRLLRNGDLVYIDVESYGQHGLTDICIDGINLDIAEQRVDLHRRRVVRLSVNICI